MDLLHLNDEAFIKASYQAVLGRDPDEHGLRHNVDLLRQGAITKRQLILGLMGSEERRKMESPPPARRLLARTWLWRVTNLLQRVASLIWIDLPIASRERFERLQSRIIGEQVERAALYVTLESALRQIAMAQADSERSNVSEHTELRKSIHDNSRRQQDALDVAVEGIVQRLDVQILQVREAFELVVRAQEMETERRVTELRQEFHARAVETAQVHEATLGATRNALELRLDRGDSTLVETRRALELLIDQSVTLERVAREERLGAVVGNFAEAQDRIHAQVVRLGRSMEDSEQRWQASEGLWNARLESLRTAVAAAASRQDLARVERRVEETRNEGLSHIIRLQAESDAALNGVRGEFDGALLQQRTALTELLSVREEQIRRDADQALRLHDGEVAAQRELLTQRLLGMITGTEEGIRHQAQVLRVLEQRVREVQDDGTARVVRLKAETDSALEMVRCEFAAALGKETEAMTALLVSRERSLREATDQALRSLGEDIERRHGAMDDEVTARLAALEAALRKQADDAFGVLRDEAVAQRVHLLEELSRIRDFVTQESARMQRLETAQELDAEDRAQLRRDLAALAETGSAAAASLSEAARRQDEVRSIQLGHEDKLASLHHLNSDLQGIVTRMESRLADLDQSLARASEHLSRSDSSVTLLAQELTEQTQRLAEGLERQRSLDDQLGLHIQAVKEVLATQAGFQAETRAIADGLVTEGRKHGLELVGTSSRMEALVESLHGFHQRLGTLESLRDKLQELDAFRQALDDLARSVASLQVQDHLGTEGGSLTNTSQRLAQIDVLEADLAAVSAVLAQHFELITAVQHKLADQATAVQTMASRPESPGREAIDRIDQEISALKGTVAERTLAITSGMESRLERLEVRQTEVLGPVRQQLSEGIERLNNYAKSSFSALIEKQEVLRRHQYDLQNYILEHDRRYLSVLNQVEDLLQADPVAQQVGRQTIVREIDRVISDLYYQFEDHFRGPSDIIRERQAFYLPAIAKAGLGSIASQMLDIGCGRGEWLELARDRGLMAYGIDLNQRFVDVCLGKGLKVQAANALDHLRMLAPRSLGVVTAFHVVEHLGHEILIDVVREIHRVLIPGGLMILETPNPDNLQVGANWFYLDPTHVRPIPSPMLKFFVEHLGFTSTEVVPLQPISERDRISLGFEDLTGRLADLLCGARDYGIIAVNG